MTDLSRKYLVLFLFTVVINVCTLLTDALVIYIGFPALTLICKEHVVAFLVVILFECTAPLFLFFHIYYAYES